MEQGEGRRGDSEESQQSAIRELFGLSDQLVSKNKTELTREVFDAVASRKMPVTSVAGRDGTYDAAELRRKTDLVECARRLGRVPRGTLRRDSEMVEYYLAMDAWWVGILDEYAQRYSFTRAAAGGAAAEDRESPLARVDEALEVGRLSLAWKPALGREVAASLLKQVRLAVGDDPSMIATVRNRLAATLEDETRDALWQRVVEVVDSHFDRPAVVGDQAEELVRGLEAAWTELHLAGADTDVVNTEAFRNHRKWLTSQVEALLQVAPNDRAPDALLDHYGKRGTGDVAWATLVSQLRESVAP